ncbi:MAG: hypothetical protein EOO90_03525 [Pedobacter sp.]|nr:MAG: hypothetical protein EOO90_03525 [Pedobacter sp.]
MQSQEKIIDLDVSMSKCGMKYYRHGSFTIDLHGINCSAPSIYQILCKKLNTDAALQFLPIFYVNHLDVTSGSMVSFNQPLYQNVAINNWKECILKIEANRVSFAYARYIDTPDFPTSLNEEVGGLLTILYVIQGLFGHTQLHFTVTINLETNGELYFAPQGSIYAVDHILSTYTLNPKNFTYSNELYNLADSEIISFMQDVINGFSSEKPIFGHHQPFLTIDVEGQIKNLNFLKEAINPSGF